MSYGLTFYSASFEGLRGEILKPSKDFLEKLRETWKTVYAPGKGESLEAGLDEGLTDLKKNIAEEKNDLAVEGVLALVAAIETYGEKLGTLEQPTGAGEMFRDEFLDGAAAKAFDFTRFGEYLTSRELFGYKPLDYPSWGALFRNELIKLSDVSASTSTGNEDFDAWLTDLAKFIKQAKEAGRDLLTVYR